MEAGGERVHVEKETMVVAYDPDTGRIAHIHHVVTLRGGHHPQDQEIEREAAEQAAETATRRGAPLRKRPSVLRIEPSSFELGVPYKVDPKTRTLVRLKVTAPVKPAGAGRKKAARRRRP